MSFNNLLIKIFKSHGFDINSSSNYSKYILASKDNINLSIGYNETGDEANVSNVRTFFRSAKKDNADMMIYILPVAKYHDNIDKFVNDRNIQLWDRERLERELGRALLYNLDSNGNLGEFEDEFDELLATTHGLDSITDASSISDVDIDTSDHRIKADHGGIGEDMPIMVPIIPFDDDGEFKGVPDTGSVFTGEDGREGHSPDPDVGFAGISSSDAMNIPLSQEVKIIKPTLSKDKAASMASKIVRGFRFNLELIPYYIFNYKCEFESDIADNKASNGVIGINGLTSNIEEWSGNITTVYRINEDHTKLETKFDYEKALDLAHHAVIELNTKSIETREESDSTIIFEKKRLKPKSDAIELNSQGIIYLPVWCIEGSNGLMIIDASSGKVVKEDFF